MRRSIRACANAALVVTSVIISILLAERGLQLLGYTLPVQAHSHSYYPQFYFKADPMTGFDIAENFPGGFFELPDYIQVYGKPFAITSNSFGCRDGSFDREEGYVLLLGDSFTWGYVPLDQDWKHWP